jgi:hypothetical protein
VKSKGDEIKETERFTAVTLQGIAVNGVTRLSTAIPVIARPGDKLPVVSEQICGNSRCLQQLRTAWHCCKPILFGAERARGRSGANRISAGRVCSEVA